MDTSFSFVDGLRRAKPAAYLAHEALGRIGTLRRANSV